MFTAQNYKRILRSSSATRTLNKLLKTGQHNRWQLVEATSPRLKIQEQRLKTNKHDKTKIYPPLALSTGEI